MRLPALAALLLALPLAAQTAVPLDEALRTARTSALDVLRADAAVQSARVSVDAVSDGRLPSLSVSTRGGQRYGLSFDETSGRLTQARVESFSVGLVVGYDVFDGAERRALGLSAEAGLRAAELDRARAEQKAAAVVLNGYLALAQADVARRVAIEEVDAQQGLLDEVTAQVELGERPAFEQAQQREQVAAAQAAIAAAERDRRLAEARLVRTLGLDPMGTYTFPVPALEADVPLPDDLVRQALDNRTDLRAAEVAVEASAADGRAARAARLPQVSLNAYVGTSYSSAGEAVLFNQVGNNRAGELGLSLSVPIFDRGVSRERIRRAEARGASLRAEEEAIRRAIALDVQELRIELDALADQQALADIRVDAATMALDAERARFTLGETTLQSVSIALARAVAARAEQERLAVTARFQRRLIQIAIGE